MIKNNLANFTTILGVLPLFILLDPESFQYLPIIIIYNNIMDDLDGILARELKISSKFGGNLDNLSDTVAHIVILWVVMIHYGGILLIFGFFPTISILVRVAKRLDNTIQTNGGSPTNELVRHILFVYLLSLHFQIEIKWFMVFVFIIHSFSLVAPFEMPHMIRSKTKSVLAITSVNIILVTAWLIPLVSPFIALGFLITYFFSFCFEGLKWLTIVNRNRKISTSCFETNVD